MRLLCVVAGTLALCGITAPAFATPITSTFTVTANSGPLAGQTSAGYFTFDSSSIVFGGFNDQTGLLTDLEFVWNGVTYTEATANTGRLGWDANGTLTRAVFGNDCFVSNCSITAGTSEWAVGWPAFAPLGAFYYTTPTSIGNFIDGTVSLTTPLGPGAPVPEPTSMLLLGTGLASAMAYRRRMKQSS